MFLTEHFIEQTLISSKIRKMNLKVIKIMIMLKIMLSDKIVHEKNIYDHYYRNNTYCHEQNKSYTGSFEGMKT